MPLAPGTRLGSYEILCALGAGGMGEVYRARDTKLGREVALKILPEAFASDPDRLMRFEREARTLAALNHPNIAQVYGVEESGQTRALVMELVAGEDLSARLARGPIPLDEALPLARQIAEALEAAHEAGIIHRDLKPANVKVRDDGPVKVLDFGLAKALDPSAPGAAGGSGATGTGAAGAPGGLADPPTLTSPALTMRGVILGTAAYMAPEQAKGKPVDRRADVWAFGCVLFEMLTGTRAFGGDDVAETLASVLRAEPAWHLLPVDTPDALRMLMRQCLEKDPQRRPSHLSVARFVLDGGIEMDRGAAALAGRSRSYPHRLRVAAGIFAALTVGAAVASALTWWVMRDGRAAIARSAPIRFLMTAETGAETWRISTDRPFALSPDGRAVAYRAHGNNRPQFFVRDLETIEPRLLIDGRLIRAPFFSPDGRWIAFFDGRELRKMRVTGGPAVTICQVSHEIVLGGSWGDDDSIVFAVSQPTSTTGYPGLLIVPASGGEPRILTTVEPTSGEGAHVHPHVLPGSRGVLFTVRMRGQPPSEGRLMVLDRASGERREVAARGTAGQYIDGRVVHVDPQGLLQSLPFDLSKLAPSGPASPLAERVYVPPVGQPLFSVASSGALAFVPAIGGTTPETVRTVVWVDRHGRETPIPLPPRAYAVARLAPDGTRIALDIRDGDNDIWIWSIARGALTRMTREPALDFGPVWSPDSRRIIWSSTRSNPNPTLHRQAADGTGAPELLGIEGSPVYPGSVTPDGKHLIFFGATFAIQRLDLASADRLETVLAGSSLQATPEVSPDGRWLAYQSNESGAPEVYVRPYPNVEAGRWQISTQGGTRPAWRRDGRELFFLDGQERLSSASIAVKGDTLVPGAVQRILDTAYYPGFTTRGFNLRGYDVSPDGQRFLMIKRTEGGADSRSELTIVLNWSASPR